MNYPDGTTISENLPKSYQPSGSKEVPAGESCANCRYYSTGYCNYWLAPARENYWCATWRGM